MKAVNQIKATVKQRIRAIAKRKKKVSQYNQKDEKSLKTVELLHSFLCFVSSLFLPFLFSYTLSQSDSSPFSFFTTKAIIQFLSLSAVRLSLSAENRLQCLCKLLFLFFCFFLCLSQGCVIGLNLRLCSGRTDNNAFPIH